MQRLVRWSEDSCGCKVRLITKIFRGCATNRNNLSLFLQCKLKLNEKKNDYEGKETVFQRV